MEGFSDGSSTLPASTKKKDTLIACLSFWASRAEGPLCPSVIQMLGGSEFRLRRGFACGKTLARRKSAAGQKAGLVRRSPASVPFSFPSKGPVQLQNRHVDLPVRGTAGTVEG